MENFSKNESKENCSYEFKLGTHLRYSEIIESLNNGGQINFLVTRDFSIWLTDAPHNSLSSKGITWRDIECLGSIRKEDGEISFYFYNEPTNSRRIKNGIIDYFK